MASLVGESFFGLDLGKVKSSFLKYRRRISKRVLLIEFGISSVNLAEIKVRNDSIALDHIRRYLLPEDALERGIPTDPVQMAALIKEHCRVEDIPAHRAAVVVPPDAAFSMLIQLPQSVASEEALAYVLDPSSSLQVPFQLDQMEVELTPLSIPCSQLDHRCYFLTAVPKKLVDRVIETIHVSGFELLKLQIGTIAQLLQLSEVVASLAFGELVIHIELLRECSLVCLVCSSGPIKLIRLTAIREFPEPDVASADGEPSQMQVTERQIVASDRYMPLSDLDLRRLVQELKQMMAEAELQFPWLRWRSVVLAGPNSAHPMLADLLQEAMGIRVELCRPLAVSGVGLVELKQPILMQRLGRLVGLGLSFLDALSSAAEVPIAPDLDDQDLLEPMEVSLVQEPEPSFALSSETDLVLPFSTPESEPVVLEPDRPHADPELQPEQEPEPEMEPIPDPVAAESDTVTPLFSFGTLDDEGERPIATSSAKPMPESLQAPSGSKVVEEAPFSMGDLLSSFEARQDIEPEQSLLETDAAEVHLLDDPSLWPSVAKEDGEVQTEDDEGSSLGS